MDRRRPTTTTTHTLSLLGTPLSDALGGAHELEDDRPASVRRKSKFDRQQTVRDEEGRRRFHGAFTGGFSAGYHNSVDSIQGFVPKSFTSHRGKASNELSGQFAHKPEDFMDAEDFGEFGIAPKKIRLLSGFTGKKLDGEQFELGKFLKHGATKNESIGEKILRCMTGQRLKLNNVQRSDNSFLDQKNNFHGLGYKPLTHHMQSSSKSSSSNNNNPLEATLKHGKKFKISGHAFQAEMLDDDDDNVEHVNEYGLDNIKEYEFEKGPSSGRTIKIRKKEFVKADHHSGGTVDDLTDDGAMSDFDLARDINVMQICDLDEANYKLPTIESCWKKPVRKEPYKEPVEISERTEQNMALFKNQVLKFNDKFTSRKANANRDICDTIQCRTGLLHYSDLKSIKSMQLSRDRDFDVPEGSHQEITIVRKIVEWRPCSLLCKHFNVPNPFPDNAYCGTRPSELSQSENDKVQKSNSNSDIDQDQNIIASLELRQSIFNYTDEQSESEDADDESEQSESDPQVVELEASTRSDLKSSPVSAEVRPNFDDKVSDDDESDVIVIEHVKQRELEVIELSSSSSRSPPSRLRALEASDSSDDLYGPPLPPSRRLLPPSTSCENSESLISTLVSANRRRKRKKKSRSSN